MKKAIFIVVAAVSITTLVWVIIKNPDSKIVVHTNSVPQPIGPYSQAVVHDNTIYVSGQIALNPKTGQLDTTSIQAETKQVMNNIRGILAASGLEMKHILKATIYLTDIKFFPQVNEVYGAFFNDKNYPARETIAVKALPKGARIEISVSAGF
jgi:2-iminobutanoate/2-iminopropanoate deaminase